MKPDAVRRMLPVLLLLLPFTAAAQDLPPADEIINRYVTLIGGRDALLAVPGMQSRGTMAIPAMGIEGAFTLSQKAPNLMRLDASLPGVGEVLSGFDGEVGWSVNPIMGAAVMDGQELEQTREQSGMAASIRDRSVVPARETVERTEVGGEACWRVRLTWASGRTSHDCYSVESGLLLRSEQVQASPMGEIPNVLRFSDYREFGGFLLATRVSASAMGVEQVMVIQEVVIGEVDASVFELPPAIRTLRGGG